jgi:hypothetical protein
MDTTTVLGIVATVLAVTQTITGIVAVNQSRRLAKAEDERRDAEAALQREREEREEERRLAAERRETEAARPVIVVEHAGASPDGGQLDRRLVKVRVANKGPTTAHRIEVGIRLGDTELKAGPGGTPRTIPALAPTDESVVLIAHVDSDVWRSMPQYEVDHPPL